VVVQGLVQGNWATAGAPNSTLMAARTESRVSLAAVEIDSKNGGTEKESFTLVVIALMVQDSFSSPPHVEGKTQQVIPVREYQAYVPMLVRD
jgi:hypothetical protein